MSDAQEHQRLVREKIRKQEEARAMATGDARAIIGEALEEKGYLPAEVEKDAGFTVKLSGRSEKVSVDYLLSPGGIRFMAIKCSMELVSRERHVLAFSRVADDFMFPLCAVTDGLEAHIMDTATGRTIGQSIESIPSREDALRLLEGTEPASFPGEKAEREKRVLMAFECTECSRD